MSSLIFVVILAVWAVYLVQHWVRRRDHVATARSVDRFSESMRVLERRRALPRPELVEPAPRSYTVSPLRPARPEVVVKHATGGATAVAPSAAYRRAKLVARLRGAGLITSSVVLVAFSALALAGVMQPWAVLLGVGILGATVAAVRWSVAREQQQRRRETTARRPVATPQSRRSTVAREAAARTRASALGEQDSPQPVRRGAVAPEEVREDDRRHAFSRQSVAAVTRPARPARRHVLSAELYDVDRVEAELARPVMPVEPEPVVPPAHAADHTQAEPETELEPGTWRPVPVPPPTYTLKPRAPRGQLTGAAELPADGNEMALDEEFEDLPRIDRVG